MSRAQTTSVPSGPTPPAGNTAGRYADIKSRAGLLNLTLEAIDSVAIEWKTRSWLAAHREVLARSAPAGGGGVLVEFRVARSNYAGEGMYRQRSFHDGTVLAVGATPGEAEAARNLSPP